MTTSVTSNMHSLIPYHIDIQAAGLLWNNSIDNSIQEQHHKTKTMFIFCLSTTMYTSVPAPSREMSKYMTILSDLHRHFHFVFSYIFACFLLISFIVQELCESRGGHPGLSILTSFLVSVDVKIYCTVLRHWSQLVPNMSTDI